MIAEILGYIVKNGEVVSNHDFIREVKTQDDIENVRSNLLEKYNKDVKPDKLGNLHLKEIDFILRQLPGTGLKY